MFNIMSKWLHLQVKYLFTFSVLLISVLSSPLGVDPLPSEDIRCLNS